MLNAIGRPSPTTSKPEATASLKPWKGLGWSNN